MEKELNEALDWFRCMSNVRQYSKLSDEDSRNIVAIYQMAKAEADRLRMIDIINKTAR